MGNCQTIEQSEVHAPRQGNVSQILISNLIWNKQYQGLYDYDCKNVTKKKFIVKGNATVIKDEGKFILMEESLGKGGKLSPDQIQNALFRLIRTDNYYQLSPITYSHQGQPVQKPLWLVIKSLPKHRYVLREKDIIKLGKQKIRVREIVISDQAEKLNEEPKMRVSKCIYDNLQFNENFKKEEIIENNDKELGMKGVTESQELITEGEPTCRICLQPGQLTNPLITPCKCIGSVRHIHLTCLKSWLTKQLNPIITPLCVTINWKPLSCQMCRTKYKYRVYLDNIKYYTVDIPKPEKPYLVLQIVKKKGKEEQGKLFKFITLKSREAINIGRKKEVDVRISEDISVSRVHAVISYNSSTKQFYLSDNQSKFGTLVLAKNGLFLRPHHAGISLQLGAELFEFEALRQQSQTKSPSYDAGDLIIREQMSQFDDDDEEEQLSEEADDDIELGEQDRSPTLNRPSLLARPSQMQAAQNVIHVQNANE